MVTTRRLIAVVVLSFVVSTGLASAQGAATLRIASLTPLTLRGSGFQSGERVLLTLSRSGRVQVTRSVRAGAEGTFRAGFPLLIAVEPCRSLVIRAAGSEGSRAVYTHRCRPGDPALP